MGKAKKTVATGKVLGHSEVLNDALRHDDISFDQAKEIASAELSAPGSAGELLDAARDEAFQVLKDKVRRVKL